MGLFIRQDENRSQLQERLAAEMAERARTKAEKQPDGVDDSAFIEGTKSTTSLAWAWILIIIAIVSIGVWVAFSVS